MGMLAPFLAFLGIALMALVTVMGAFLGGSDDVLDARLEGSQRSSELIGTTLTVDVASVSGATVTIDVRNTGRVSLRDFPSWDIWASFHESDDTYHAGRLDYTSAATPGAGQWAVENLYLNTGGGAVEAFQPGILDPQEVIRIQLRTTPTADAAKENTIVVSTPNGVRITATW